MVADGVTASQVTVRLEDAQGNALGTSGGKVVVSATGAALASPVTDNGNGTYSALVTNRVVESVTVSATLDGAAIADTAEVQFTPGAASVARSTVTATSPVVADGVTASQVTVRLEDAQGNALGTSGGKVVVSATGAALASPVTDNGNGTYSALVTNRVVESVTVSATLDGAAIADTAEVQFTPGAASVARSTVTATSPVVADGVTASQVTVRLEDAQGNALGTSGGKVVVSATGAALASPVTDNGNGTYSALVTNRVVESVTVSATLDGAAIADTAEVQFTPGAASVARSTVTATSPVVADGVTASQVTVRLEDAQGNALGTSGGKVVVSATGAALASPVTDNGNGTYSALVTNRVVESVTVSATLDGAAIADTAEVQFTPGAASVARSTVTATSPVVADGVTASQVTVRLEDAQGNALGTSGGKVVVSATGAALASPVTDNGNGTYSALVTNRVVESVTVSATLDGAAIADTAEVQFTPGAASVARSTVTATSPVVADGVTASQVTVRLEDAQGNALGTSGGKVVVSATGAALASPVTDNGNGTYSALVTNRVVESVTVSATLDGAAIADTAEVQFTPGAASVARSTVTATSPVVADGVTASQVTVRLEDAQGNALGTSGGKVVVSATGAALASPVTDNGNGTYSALVTNRVVESVTVSATLDGAAIADTAEVQFTPGAASVARSTVTATSPVVADGVTASQVTVRLEDAQGNALGTSGGKVVVSATGAALASPVTDNGNGTYSALVTNRVVESVTVSATLDGAAIADTAEVQFTPGAASVAGTVILVVKSEDKGTVRFQSKTEVFNVAVLVSGGASRSDEISVTAGDHAVDYVLPAGFSVKDAYCSASGNTIDKRARRLSLSIAPAVLVRCTLLIEDAATRTANEIADFMEERAWLIMSHRSDRHRRIARLKDERLGAFLKIHGDKIPGIPGQIASPLSLATEGAEKLRIQFSCTQSTSGGAKGNGASCGRNDWWLESSVGRYTHGEAKGTYAVTHAGIDRRLGQDALVGLAMQYDRVLRDGKGDRPGATFRSDGWMAGPYITARLNDRLYFDAGISAGTATNRINMSDGGASGTFNSQRFSAYATLLGDFDHGRWNIRPQLSFGWYEETARAWTATGADGNTVPIFDVQIRTGDLEAGVRLSHTMPDGLSSQYFEIDGVLALAGNTDKENRLRMRTGMSAAMPFGGVLDAGISFDGLGNDDWQAYALKFAYSVSPFWLPGTVDVGLSFNGVGVERLGFRGLTLGFRSVPDPWFGGILTASLFHRRLTRNESGIGGDASMSAGFAYGVKF